MKKLFLALQALIYAALILGDFSGRFPTGAIKFSCIILCALYSLYLLGNKAGFRRLLFAFIRLLTVGGDYFLTLTGRNYLAGVMLFAAIEVLYGLMLFNRRTLLWRIGVTIVIAAGMRLMGYDLLYVFSGVSLVNLSFNVIDTAMLKKPLLFRGFVLFLLCDVSVGMNTLNILAPFTAYSPWVFYLPSQVLLCLGVSNHEEE
ncbi:MAG: hypothetical protein IJM79_05385 [Erysipelotrichaceae bacterium]|nr:hypothetical protein [Erysipelotrichaceae bacterium]